MGALIISSITVRRSSRPQVFKIPSLRSSFLVRSTSSRRSQACTSWSDMDDADQCSSALCGKLHGFASSLQSAQHSILTSFSRHSRQLARQLHDCLLDTFCEQRYLVRLRFCLFRNESCRRSVGVLLLVRDQESVAGECGRHVLGSRLQRDEELQVAPGRLYQSQDKERQLR